MSILQKKMCCLGCGCHMWQCAHEEIKLNYSRLLGERGMWDWVAIVLLFFRFASFFAANVTSWENGKNEGKQQQQQQPPTHGMKCHKVAILYDVKKRGRWIWKQARTHERFWKLTEQMSTPATSIFFTLLQTSNRTKETDFSYSFL